MTELPLFVSILFGLTVLLTIGWIYQAIQSKTFLWFVIGWTLLQAALGLSGIYQDTDAMPPRIMLFGIFPALIIVLITFFNKKGRAMMDQTDLKTLTYFHSIRLPVEICLTLLYHYGVMSVFITFEGTNFDIISGVSAPIIAYLAFHKGEFKKKLLLIWNVLALLLLFNVVITAIFAIPSPFQKLAFDQPNIAVLYFPFNLLPTVVVPLVFFGHLVAIKRLI